MPENRQPRSVELFIVDIILADFRINEYLRGVVDAEHLRQDSMRWDATIRQLEIVGEAMGNILKDDVLAAAAPDYFRKVVNFRNTITHGYFGIDADEVWSVIKRAMELETADLERLGDRAAAKYLRHIQS